MALRFSSWKVSLFRIVKSVSEQDSVERERGREGGREREGEGERKHGFAHSQGKFFICI